MIQCIACEDWFHGEHLETTVPETYCEMICKSCTSGFDFLRYYQDEMATDAVSGDNVVEAEGEHEISTNGHEEGPVVKKLKSDSDEKEVCELAKRKAVEQPPIDKASFWNENWRESLCKCPSCMKMYEELKCAYLPDLEDTILSYEEKGRKRNLSGGSSIEEAGQAALNAMPRTAQIEMIHGYNDLKEELSNFLRPFAERGEVITAEHMKQFFEQFRKKKESEPKVDVFSGCR